MPNESIVLASAIDARDAVLPPHVSKMLEYAPGSFDDPAHGRIAVIVRTMRAKGELVNLVTVGSSCLDSAWKVSAIMGNALPLEEAEAEAEKCLLAFQARRALTIGEGLIQGLKDAPEQAANVISAARVALDSVTSETCNGLPNLIDAAEFVAAPIDLPAELVAGLLHKGSKLVFGGGSKSYKTWCLLDLALSVATGANWMGCETTPGKVLFLNFEIQEHAMHQRIKDVANAKGIELRHGQVDLLNLRGHAADYRQLIPRIIERTRRAGYALIILDPIYKLYGGADENAAGDVANLLNSLERLATETSAAIAFGHHFAKGNASGKEAIDRMSGSGVFARDADSLLVLTKHAEDDAYTVDPILRNFPPVAAFAVRWQFPLMHPAVDLDPAKLKKAGGRPAKHRPEDLLSHLPPDGLTQKEWLAAAAKKKISERTFYRLREELEMGRKVHHSADTGKWTKIEPEN